MATVGISRNRVYTDEPAIVVAEPFTVRARLTAFELLALAAVIGVCFSLIAFEFGYRRPARAAAEAAVLAQKPARVAVPPAAQSTARAADVVPAVAAPTGSTATPSAAPARGLEGPLRAEHAEIQRMNTCASLVGEQAQILRRAGDATVLTQVHTADRARATEIDAALQRLRCNG
jgi:hypothetical protein